MAKTNLNNVNYTVTSTMKGNPSSEWGIRNGYELLRENFPKPSRPQLSLHKELT